MSAHPAASGAADAAALLARAAVNDVAGMHELVDTIVRGDSARECLLTLAALAGGFANASADLRGAPLQSSLDHAAEIVVDVVRQIEEREQR